MNQHYSAVHRHPLGPGRAFMLSEMTPSRNRLQVLPPNVSLNNVNNISLNVSNSLPLNGRPLMPGCTTVARVLSIGGVSTVPVPPVAHPPVSHPEEAEVSDDPYDGDLLDRQSGNMRNHAIRNDAILGVPATDDSVMGDDMADMSDMTGDDVMQSMRILGSDDMMGHDDLNVADLETDI